LKAIRNEYKRTLQTKHVGESPTCAHHRVWRKPELTFIT
jgi:hypothetical protein